MSSRRREKRSAVSRQAAKKIDCWVSIDGRRRKKQLSEKKGVGRRMGLGRGGYSGREWVTERVGLGWVRKVWVEFMLGPDE